MSINLPLEKRTKAKKINPRILLLYGPPKVGKSTIASQLENNLILDIEKGSDYLETGLIMKANSWEKVMEIGEAIKAAGKPYKYLTLDTATELEEWCDALGKRLYLAAPSAGKKYKDNPDLLASIKVLPGNDGGYGPGYQWLRIAYGMCFNYLRSLAEHFIIIAHVRDSTLVDNKGNEIHGGSVLSKNLDLTGKLKAITCSRADSIGFIYRKIVGAENGKPVSELRVNFSGSEVMAGSRARHLVGQDFEFDWNKIFMSED